MRDNKIKLFESKQVRTLWNAEEEDWYFSVVDIVAILTDNDYQGARNYWKVLKSRLAKEGSELVTFCNRLKMRAEDGKMRMTDCLDTKGVLRLVQSIPSPKAEPFKMRRSRQRQFQGKNSPKHLTKARRLLDAVEK